MIKPTEMFICTCDNCGCGYGNEDYDYLVMPDEQSMKEQLGDDGNWYTIQAQGGEPTKHYCPDCFLIDGNDNLIIKPVNQE